MSKEKQITIEEYRKKHKRCKTCIFAEKNNIGWTCRAKGQRYEYWPEGIKGCFCKLYQPKEFKL